MSGNIRVKQSTNQGSKSQSSLFRCVERSISISILTSTHTYQPHLHIHRLTYRYSLFVSFLSSLHSPPALSRGFIPPSPPSPPCTWVRSPHLPFSLRFTFPSPTHSPSPCFPPSFSHADLLLFLSLLLSFFLLLLFWHLLQHHPFPLSNNNNRRRKPGKQNPCHPTRQWITQSID